jgi:hypothetical protein
MFGILLIVALLLLGRRPKELVTHLQEALYRLRYYQYHPTRPRPDLRGVEWLALAIAVLFLELIWVASRY